MGAMHVRMREAFTLSGIRCGGDIDCRDTVVGYNTYYCGETTEPNATSWACLWHIRESGVWLMNKEEVDMA